MIENPAKKTDIFKKHIMAFDYGRKFTGVSSYRYGIDPFPLAFGRIPYQSDSGLITSIKKLIEEEFVDIVVLGIPYFTDGTESKLTKEIKLFAQKLSIEISCPLYVQDEALTTFEAEQRMLNDPKYNFQVDTSKIDAVAATIIMEEFIQNSQD